MFPEIRLTVNEVEKMAVGEEIQLCQSLAEEQGGQRAEAWETCPMGTPHCEGSLWHTPPIRAKWNSAWHTIQARGWYPNQATR